MFLGRSTRISAISVFFFLVIFGKQELAAQSSQDSLAKDSTRMESPQRVRSVTKTNPFPMLWGPVPLTSEFRIVQEFTTHPYQSMQFGFSILRKSPIIALIEDTFQNNDRYIIKGWRFQIAKRYYNKSKLYSPYGFYFSPSFSYSTASITSRNARAIGYYITGTHYNASLLVGAQPIIFEAVAIDLFFGLGYQNKIWKEYYQSRGIIKDIDPRDLGLLDLPVKLTAGFNIGICF